MMPACEKLKAAILIAIALLAVLLFAFLLLASSASSEYEQQSAYMELEVNDRYPTTKKPTIQ